MRKVFQGCYRSFGADAVALKHYTPSEKISGVYLQHELFWER